jgi:hypothetical protein
MLPEWMSPDVEDEIDLRIGVDRLDEPRLVGEQRRRIRRVTVGGDRQLVCGVGVDRRAVARKCGDGCREHGRHYGCRCNQLSHSFLP